jgi:hypothetical protein
VTREAHFAKWTSDFFFPRGAAADHDAYVCTHTLHSSMQGLDRKTNASSGRQYTVQVRAEANGEAAMCMLRRAGAGAAR